jgi:DNA-binding transcriptional ArsR family regulator
MVVRYELVGTDLGGVRFAISPLNEVVLSLRSWRDPGRYPAQLPWLRLTQDMRAVLDGEMLLALTNEALWTPDFLSPVPGGPLTRLEDELDAVARVDLTTVVADLRVVHQRLPRPLAGPPDRALARIVGALRGYWQACFLPWWPRLRAVLEGDVTYRGRVIAQQGLSAMFADLHHAVRLNGEQVEVRLRSTTVDYARPATGGLTLIPTLFANHVSAPITADAAPVVMYPARGLGTLWETQPMTAPRALEHLLGRVRAGLLAVLTTPASSTELAVRLGVTTTAVNQHLRALRDGGLLLSARHGRSMLYRRTDLGDRLAGDRT